MDEKDLTQPQPGSEGAQTPGAGSRAFQRSGVELLTQFHIVDKIAKIYDTKNDAFQERGRLLFETVAAVVKDSGEASLRVRQGTLLLNGVRLKFGRGTYGTLH